MPHDQSSGLLFAVFAIHLNFITRDQLAAATAEWIRQPTRPIAEILVEQEAIDRRTRGIVEDVVSRHLEQHGGDTEQSIADLGAKGMIPAEFAWVIDGGVTTDATTAVSTGAAAPDASDLVSLHGYAAGGTRYRLVRPHGHGGMGEVFVGRDLELGREVLLKQLPDKRADDARHRAAFLKEVRAGAALEHPNIAPVYDVGQHEDGRLFHVMRLIPGETFQQAIRTHHASPATAPQAERLLRFRELLGHFVDACQAIEYAHSRGVLHRDIKPNNIMLGSFGETQVIDWGLARVAGHDLSASPGSRVEPVSPDVVGDGSEATRHGDFKGTPAFASPEQAAGQIDLIDSRSDVYGLGATLYNLLTGGAPFHSHSPMLMDDVRQGRFPRPRQVRSDVPPALESICLKAMAHAPLARYASARDLATDVERWLADEPVLAHPDPVLVRLRRWGRRHRAAVAAAAALLLTSVVGLAIGYVAVKEQRDAAQNSRDVAQKSTDLTRHTIETLLKEIGDDSWAQIPNTAQKRITMVTEAVKLYRDLVKSNPTDEAAAIGLADSLFRLAYLHSFVGDDGPAEKLHREAQEHFERLRQFRLDNEDRYRDLMDGRIYFGEAMLNGTGPLEAEPYQRQTLRIAEAFFGAHPESKLAEEMVARCRGELADSLLVEEKLEEGIELLEAAAVAYGAIADADPDRYGSRVLAAASGVQLARGYRLAGRIDQGAKWVDEALKRIAFVSQLAPDVVMTRLLRAAGLGEEALSKEATGADAAALGLLDEAIGQVTLLGEEQPLILQYQRLLTEWHAERARVRQRLDRPDAGDDAERAVEIAMKLAAPAAGTFRPEVSLTTALLTRADLRIGTGDHAGARSDLDSAEESLRRTRRSPEGPPHLDRLQAEAQRLRARCLPTGGD